MTGEYPAKLARSGVCDTYSVTWNRVGVTRRERSVDGNRPERRRAERAPTEWSVEREYDGARGNVDLRLL